MKYLVYAFYPNLGIPVRVTDYENKRDLFEYVSALRMCDTAYCIQDVSSKDNPLTIKVEYTPDVGRQKMIEMLSELWREE